VPTFAEQGFPDVVVTTWFGFAVPSATPRDIVMRLNAEINAILATEDVRERFAGAGLVPVGGPPEQFDSLIRSEMQRWAQVIKTRGIRAD
jgi:tripartite-type tricarboxylate transporter receptor subunit TctC